MTRFVNFDQSSSSVELCKRRLSSKSRINQQLDFVKILKHLLKTCEICQHLQNLLTDYFRVAIVWVWRGT